MIQIVDRPSPNFDARTRPIDLVVLHYTGMQSAEIAIERLIDPKPVAGKYPGPWQNPDIDPEAPLSRVSTHYVVDEAGVVHRLVAEENRAWHAGVSSWEGEADVNQRAIGIEIVNGGHDFDLPDFTAPQIDTVIALLEDILDRWPSLTPARVVGHSDIAPERKLDPGEKFPWKRLADAGVSIWPAANHPPISDDDIVGHVQAQLALIGYGVKATGAMDATTKAALLAFQRRFRPTLIDGVADEETRALLAGVVREIQR